MKPKNFQRITQPTPAELTDSCLSILRTKFYAGDDRGFYQDRRKLLNWVVLMPAKWLNNKGVTFHGDQYREIFVKVFIQAAAHVASKVHYRPAYLRHVIQEHFKHHGEDYYDQAKATRNLVEQAMVALGQRAPAAPDPVRELATAAALLQAPKRKLKPAVKTTQPELKLLYNGL